MARRMYRQDKGDRRGCGASEQFEETARAQMELERWIWSGSANLPAQEGYQSFSLDNGKALKIILSRILLLPPQDFFCTKHTKRKHGNLNENNSHESSNIECSI